jgi:hypothetical protein
MLLKLSHSVSGFIEAIASLRVRRRLGQRLTAKCPQCGGSDLRVSDRKRTRPDVYGSRSHRLKWVCFNCSYHEMQDVEEPN